MIGTLRNGTTDQLNLSLIFGFDVPATFTITNTGSVDKDAVVYLSGDADFFIAFQYQCINVCINSELLSFN